MEFQVRAFSSKRQECSRSGRLSVSSKRRKSPGQVGQTSAASVGKVQVRSVEPQQQASEKFQVTSVGKAGQQSQITGGCGVKLCNPDRYRRFCFLYFISFYFYIMVVKCKVITERNVFQYMCK